MTPEPVQDQKPRHAVPHEPPTDQQVLALHAPARQAASGSLSVLDLFSGIGGLSTGFRANGFSVIGCDIEPVAEQVFQSLDQCGFIRADLSTTMVAQDADLVIGGPPCRPWSAVNQRRRLNEHDDHHLLARFFGHVREIRPAAFLMENVPAVGSDPSFVRWLDVLRADGYRSASHLVRYSDYGGASSRTRRFTVGFRRSLYGAREFFAKLRSHKAPARTVHEAIFWARSLRESEVPDHDWSQLRTIQKYQERYQTGRFGWKQLNYNEPAPSFGSVAKTYILHPESGSADFPPRVVSVREVLSIMDFGLEVAFPKGTPRSKRYQMAANAVSPKVAGLCATVLRQLLGGE